MEAIAAALRVATAFSTDRLQYQPGDSISIALKNTTSRTIGQNLCTITLEQKQNDGWLSMPSLRLCTAALYPLEPNESAHDVFFLGDGQETGTYRFMVKIYLPETNANSAIYSNTFTVE